MLACSSCTTVAPAGWFPVGPIVILLAVAGAVGIALLVTTRPGRRERLGAVLLGGATLAVIGSIVVGHSTNTVVYVETTPPPIDGSAWSVSCESPFQPSDGGNTMQAQFIEACASATAGDRTVIYLLLGLAAASLVAGAAMLWPTKERPRRPDETDWSARDPERFAPV